MAGNKRFAKVVQATNRGGGISFHNMQFTVTGRERRKKMIVEETKAGFSEVRGSFALYSKGFGAQR